MVWANHWTVMANNFPKISVLDKSIDSDIEIMEMILEKNGELVI